MKILPNQLDQRNPVVIVMGVVFVVAGGYGLLIMGTSGPPVLWILRGIPAVFLAAGMLILGRQLQLWKRTRRPR